MAARHMAPARRARGSRAKASTLPSPAQHTPATPVAAEERANVYARVTDAIVAAIEAGAARGPDWRMPWHRRRDAGAFPALPVNVASRAAYRGVNVLALWAAAEAKGYPAGLWGTYRQWSELGGQVRKGERATTVVFWRFPAGGGRGDAGGEGAGAANGEAEDEGGGPWARAYAVFNAAQVDGATLPADTVPHLPEEARIGAAEAFFAALPGLDLRHGGTAAFYAPATDHVQMPRFADFRTAGGYYATLAHEVTHDAACRIMRFHGMRRSPCARRRRVGAA